MLVTGRLLTLHREAACAPFLRLCVGQGRGYIAAVPVHIPILSVGTGARTHEPRPLARRQEGSIEISDTAGNDDRINSTLKTYQAGEGKKIREASPLHGVRLCP